MSCQAYADWTSVIKSPYVRSFRPLLSSEITNFAMYLSRHVAVAYFFSELGILIRKYSLDRQKRHILLHNL